MINNILDVAKLDSGTMPIEKDPMSIFETAEAVVESLKSQAEKEHIKLHIVRETELKQLMGDKNLLHRVITNLTGNSLKFTPENGEIKIILTDKGDKLRVSVNDTGEGMPAEYLDKIFNKFEQVKSSRARSKGTGLGLTISKHVVEAHGGTIWVESELGVGSTFIFEIPWEHDVDNK